MVPIKVSSFILNYYCWLTFKAFKFKVRVNYLLINKTRLLSVYAIFSSVVHGKTVNEEDFYEIYSRVGGVWCRVECWEGLEGRTRPYTKPGEVGTLVSIKYINDYLFPLFVSLIWLNFNYLCSYIKLIWFIKWHLKSTVLSFWPGNDTKKANTFAKI